MKLFKAVILSVVALVAVPAFSQDPPAAADMQILLEKVKADKKLIVAANMDLTEAEAKVFWPVYDKYQKDLQALDDRVRKLVLAYADGYNKKALTDEQAWRLTNEALAIDSDEVKLRADCLARLNGPIPQKKVTRYLQIENKIRAAIRYELAIGIPPGSLMNSGIFDYALQTAVG